MLINGFVKTSLVDYPGHIATTIFTGGCNMRCPFCHNKSLVLPTTNNPLIQESEFFDFIEKRGKTLEAICISGGEPTLQKDLLNFLRKLKQYPLKVKLDTNGLRPDLLKLSLEEELLDFVAMDIKNTREKYNTTVGLPIDTPLIETSIDLLKKSGKDYEFRTTVIKELHTYDDILSIGKWLETSKRYVLQNYRFGNEQLTSQAFTSYSRQEMLVMESALAPFFENIDLRGF